MSLTFEHIADAIEIAMRRAKRTDIDQVVWRVSPDPVRGDRDRYVIVPDGTNPHFTCQARPVALCRPAGREISG